MPRYKIIANPSAGRGLVASILPQIEQTLRQLQLDFDLERTTGPWHAADMAHQAVIDGYDVVASVGGDGTFNEVLNGLMVAKNSGLGQACLGILPVGRGNDFAFSMGVPVDWKAACETLAAGQRRWIDVGRVCGGLYPEGRFFGNGIGIGFDAVVGFEAAKHKYISGFPSYLVAAFKTMSLYFNAPLIELDCDGEKSTQACLMVSIMNGRRMGGGFFMAPRGIADDGLFDLCIVRQVSRLKVLRLIPHFFDGSQFADPAVSAKRAGRVRATALRGVLPAHADGETLCTHGQQLDIEILPRQIEMIYQPALIVSPA